MFKINLTKWRACLLAVPVAFVHVASPVRPLVLIYNSMAVPLHKPSHIDLIIVTPHDTIE